VTGINTDIPKGKYGLWELYRFAAKKEAQKQGLTSSYNFQYVNILYYFLIRVD